MKGRGARIGVLLAAAGAAALGVGDSPRKAAGLDGSLARTGPSSSPSPREASVRAAFARLPLAFVENRGQWEDPARFAASRGGMRLHLAPDSLTLQLLRRGTAEVPRDDEQVQGVNLRLLFEGASEEARIEGEGELPGRFNYFLGNDPTRWRTGVPAFERVVCEGLYAGVDLVVREEGSRPEYDLRLAPGADLDRVVVRVEGARTRLGDDGSLVMETAFGEVRQPAPRTWEEGAGRGRRPVECRYRMIGEGRYGFEIPVRDAAARAVIDPGLVYATLLGGVDDDTGWGVVLDSTGAAIVAGRTYSPDFPTTSGAFDTVHSGGPVVSDCFVAKLSPSGSALIYSTFLGGANADAGYVPALSSSGAVTVTGRTRSMDFPTTTGAYDTTFNGVGADIDVFVARLSPTGDALVYSTYLGGSSDDQASALALDAAGVATVAGRTASSNFPTTSGAYDTSYNGNGDVFATRLSSSGQSLVWSTFLGGTQSDGYPGLLGLSLAVTTNGSPWLAGWTSSSDFPTSGGPFDPSYNGNGDAFVTRLSATGNALSRSTYLGGSEFDFAHALSLDASGRPTVAGETLSPDFPTTTGAFDTTFGGIVDAFVARVSTTAGSLVFSTFLGGVDDDAAVGLDVSSSGASVVTGGTLSPDFPTSAGAFDTTLNGSFDVFATRLSPSGNLLYYSTFLGGSNSGEYGWAVTLDATEAAVATGWAVSTDFPATPGAFQTTFGGLIDSFAACLDLLPAGADRYGTSTPGCAGALAVGVTSIPKVGNASFSVTCSNAPASAGGFLGVSAGALGSPFFVLGVGIWIDPISTLILFVGSNTLGAVELPISIPPDPALAGAHTNLQFLFPSPCGSQGFSASNALAITFQP